MSRIVNTEGEEVFNRFDFSNWSNEKHLEFLEKSIELRVKHLLKRQDPRFTASISVVLVRLNLPLHCQKDIDHLKEKHAIESDEFKQELLLIEAKLFGALETK